jgi:cobalt-zinc-cadmium efflux system membrane fusion protein
MKLVKHILFIALIFFTSCKKTDAAKELLPKEEDSNFVHVSIEQFKKGQMELVSISEHTFNQVVSTNGYIDVPPANKAKVSALITGYVNKSDLLVGDKVIKGQLLLTLESPDIITIQKEYLEISEQLSYLKSDFERQEKLFNEKITSEKKFLEAKSNYKSSLAEAKGLESKLRLLKVNLTNIKNGEFTSMLPIYAPISGVISKVNVSKGSHVNEADVILEIINDTHKHLELVVFEKDVFKVKEKQPIKFNIPENSTEQFEGYVHLIGKSIDEINRTAKLHGHINNEKNPFLVGMFVEAQIIISSDVKRALPTEAVLEEDEKYFILKVIDKSNNEYKLQKAEVHIGNKTDDWVEIINFKAFEGGEILGKGAFIPLGAD